MWSQLTEDSRTSCSRKRRAPGRDGCSQGNVFEGNTRIHLANVLGLDPFPCCGSKGVELTLDSPVKIIGETVDRVAHNSQERKG
jgi:hypothetical protein